MMELDEFITLEGDEFADQFGWVDWREDDTAVIEMFRSQLGDSASIEYVEERGAITVQYRGRSHAIPYVSLMIAVLVLSVIAWGLVLKHSEPDCRVRVDGECIDSNAE